MNGHYPPLDWKDMNIYILMNNEGKYVHVDRASGWPALMSSVFDASHWPTAEAAAKYRGSDNFTIFRIKNVELAPVEEEQFFESATKLVEQPTVVVKTRFVDQ